MKQKHWIMLIIIAIIIGAGLFVYIQKNYGPESDDLTVNDTNQITEPIGDVPNDANTPNPAPTTDTVAVSTQLAGDSVTIDNVFLSKAGFITIHEVDAKGKAGKIIGTSGLLSTGGKQDLEIKAMLVAGSKYIAMLREDNGDKKFTDSLDKAVTNKGIPVMTMFSVSQ